MKNLVVESIQSNHVFQEPPFHGAMATGIGGSGDEHDFALKMTVYAKIRTFYVLMAVVCITVLGLHLFSRSITGKAIPKSSHCSLRSKCERFSRKKYSHYGISLFDYRIEVDHRYMMWSCWRGVRFKAFWNQENDWLSFSSTKRKRRVVTSTSSIFNIYIFSL